MKRTLRTSLATFAAAALVLTAGQAFAVGTESGTDIANTASVSYTIAGTPTTTPSNTETFRVDRKINPVVTNTGNATVVAGGTGYVLTFTVDNFSNTKAGVTDYFNIAASEVLVGDDFNMSPGYTVYNDDGGTPGSYDGTNTAVTNPVIIGLGAQAIFFIVADAPVTATAPALTAQYDLVATAVNAAGVALVEAGSNGQLVEDIAFGDGAGTGDALGDGAHSDRGTYTTAGTLAVTKAATNPGFNIPGSTVTYTITVNNADATNPASGVTISDAIPGFAAGYTLYSAGTLVCSAGFTAEYDHGGVFSTTEAPANTVAAVRCTGGSIAAPGSASMTFNVVIQ